VNERVRGGKGLAPSGGARPLPGYPCRHAEIMISI